MRRRFGAPPSASTTNTTSTFAAATCSSASVSAALRENAVRLGSTAWITPSRRSTQSPTAGKSAGALVSWRNRPDTAAAVSPPAVNRTYAPRCCTATRAGSRWSVVTVARTASHAASQPSAASRGSIAPPSSRRGPSGHDAEGRKVRRRQDRRCGTWRSQAPSFEAPPSIRRAFGARARNDSIRVE